MVSEIFKEILAFIGLMTVMVAVLGVAFNLALYRNWYGETESQRRERLRKERDERRQQRRPA